MLIVPPQRPVSPCCPYSGVYVGVWSGTAFPDCRKAAEGKVVDRIDPRIWYAVAAVVVVLLLAWLLGWFGGTEAPAPTTTP